MRTFTGLAALVGACLVCAPDAEARVVVPVERTQALARGHVEAAGEDFARLGDYSDILCGRAVFVSTDAGVRAVSSAPIERYARRSRGGGSQRSGR